MALPRVFVIWNHPLFYESLRLLLNHPDIEWAGATSDYASALAQTERLQPDTILVEEGEDGLPAQALELLKTSPCELRIISLNLSDNQLNVYYRELHTVVQAEDLLHLIIDR